MAQVRWLGPKVGSRLALFCSHGVNRVNSRNDSEMNHDDSTINIFMVITTLMYYIIHYYYYYYALHFTPTNQSHTPNDTHCMTAVSDVHESMNH